jgi:hypothetical protein
MSSYIVEPWGRDKYRQAGVLFNSEAVCAEMDRLVARLVEQGIDPATFERYVVDEDRKPFAGPEAQHGTAVGGRRNTPADDQTKVPRRNDFSNRRRRNRARIARPQLDNVLHVSN